MGLRDWGLGLRGLGLGEGLGSRVWGFGAWWGFRAQEVGFVTARSTSILLSKGLHAEAFSSTFCATAVRSAAMSGMVESCKEPLHPKPYTV